MKKYIYQKYLQPKKTKIGLAILAIFLLLIVFVSLWFPLLQSAQIVIGSILVLFLPGFFATLIFFPHHDSVIARKKEVSPSRSLDMIERITLAILLSIIITSAVVYILARTIAVSSQGVELYLQDLAIFIILANVVLAGIIFIVWRYRSRN